MRKMNMGGSIPRQTTIQGQRHDLAYINPFEVDLLESYNAAPGGVAGPGNVPAYPAGYGVGGYDGGGSQGGMDGGGMGPGGPGGYDVGIGQVGIGPDTSANDSNASFDAFGDAYGTQAEAQAADVAAQAQAAQAGFQEGYGKPMKTDPLTLVQKQMIADEEDAKSKKGLAGLIAKIGVKSKNAQRQAMIDELTGKNKTSAFQGMMQKAGLAGTPTQFEPVFDIAGNLVGSAGISIDEDGNKNVVSYSGDRTANLADGPVKDRVDAMNEINQGGPGDGPDIPEIEMDPCPEGFVMDAETNVCVPVGDDGDDGDGDDDGDDTIPPYVPPSEVVGPPSYTPIGGPGSFVPTPLQPYPNQQMYQMMPPPPLVTMMVGEEQG